MDVKVALFSLAALTLFVACSPGEPGSGTYAQERREVSSFSRVQIEGGGIDRVKIVVCDCTGVRISGDDNLIDYVSTRQQGDTLEIGVVDDVDPELELTVEVRTPALELVRVEGSSFVDIVDLRGGDLVVETQGSGDVAFIGRLDNLRFETSGSSDIDVERLELEQSLDIQTSGSSDIVIDRMSAESVFINTSGSSDVRLKGSARSLSIETSGSSDIRARELRADDVSVRTSGSSDVQVCAQVSLDVRVSGSGDIDYWCAPGKVTKSISGSGSVRSKD